MRKEILDQVLLLEQFLKTLIENVRVFVKERHPKTSKKVKSFVDDCSGL